MFPKRIASLVILLLAITLLVNSPGNAQPIPCPDVVEQAIVRLGNSCTNLEPNQVCYGSAQVETIFADPQLSVFFSQPGDRTELTQVQYIRTGPLDLTHSEWGLAVMNLMALLPDILPGQSVTFVLMGNVQLENSSVVQPDSGQPPMQTFYFRAGIGASECVEAPSVLAVRTTGGVTLNLVVNNAGIQIGGTDTTLVTFQQEADNRIDMTVHEGQAQTSTGEVISEGETISAALITPPPTPTPELTTLSLPLVIGTGTPEGGVPMLLPDIIGDVGAIADFGPWQPINLWSEPRPATLEELQMGQVALRVVVTYEQVQPNLQPIEPPAPPPTEEAPPQLDTPPCTTGQNIVHVVQPGENLFRIALRYGLDVTTVAAQNGMGNPQVIFVGQQIVIPCGASFTPQQPLASTGTCGSFRATSPLDGLTFGMETFFWDPAPNATTYQVNVYNEQGHQAASFTTAAPATNLVGDVGQAAGDGIVFSCEVLAFNGSQLICASPRTSMMRESPPPAPPPPATPIPTNTPVNIP